MKKLFCVLTSNLMFLFVSSITQAAPALDDKAREAMALKIKAGYNIVVDQYQKDSDSYVITIEAEPDTGPNYTTLEWILKAVDNDMSLKEYKRNPSRLVSSLFKLKKSLWLLSDEEMAERKAKSSKKKVAPGK